MFGLVKSLAEKDSLTLLYTTVVSTRSSPIELERANRYARPMAVIILDLDTSRDQRPVRPHDGGPGAGAGGGRIGGHLRKTDIAARYGGTSSR